MSRAIPFNIVKVAADGVTHTPDVVAAEEPLEIKLGYGSADNRRRKSLSVTMRTPGHDFELALGFLLTEGIVSGEADIKHIKYCRDEKGELSPNVVRVELSESLPFDFAQFERHFYTNSSCGVCGKASIESLTQMCPTPLPVNSTVSKDVITSLPGLMRESQDVFEHTGGLHAAGLFSFNGDMLLLREDIGRHNAVDKVMGASMEHRSQTSDLILMLSGRSCFELIQKAAVAGVSVVASVGAPSSLALQTAKDLGITLIGFLRNDTFNIYSLPQRISGIE